jgi:hypothetical protein
MNLQNVYYTLDVQSIVCADLDNIVHTHILNVFYQGYSTSF